MITFKGACDIALKFYKDRFDIDGICQPSDIGSAWVFNGGHEDEVLYGIQMIAISKEDGTVSAFNLPSKKNFALLKAGTALELPAEYR